MSCLWEKVYTQNKYTNKYKKDVGIIEMADIQNSRHFEKGIKLTIVEPIQWKFNNIH